MSYEKLLNITCNIERPSTTQTATGEVTKTYTPVASDVPTRKQRNKEQSIIDVDYKTTLEDFKFYFMPDVDVRKSDHLVIGSQRWEVLAAIHDSSGRTFTAYARIKSHE